MQWVIRDVECTLQILKRGAEDRAKAADIVLHDVRDALELLLAPRRLLATLRS